MAKFNEAFEESLRADGASRQKSINSSTLRDVITNRSPDDYAEGAGQSKINNALRFFDKAGILDMTVEQLASDEGRVTFVNAMTGDAYAELGKNQANEASKFISGIFEDAGHGKAWGSNTLKRELSPAKAKELFPIEAAQQKVKGYPADFFTRTKRVVMELQAAGQKEAAAQFLLSITGGYRSADVRDVKVEDIDFRTGVLFDVEVKGAGETVDKTGIFSSPQLDVIKDYLGGRTEGLLFADPEANSKIINAQLKKSFPSDYLIKKSKARGTYTTGVTLYDYRHFNETYLSSLDVSPELRKVATLRAPSDVSEKYAASGARRKDVNRLHGGLLSLYAAGSNTSSSAQFLNDILSVDGSQPELSDKTRKLTATRELIEQVGYEDAVSPALYASLPEEGDVMGTRVAGINPETTAALDQQIQSEATKAALQADIDAGAMAEEAAAARAKTLETKAEQKAEAAAKTNEQTRSSLLNKAMKFGKPIIKTVFPPAMIGLGMIAADQTRSAVVNSALANQARDLGIPEGAIQTAGVVAGATEFLPVTPTDVIAGASAISSDMAESRAGQPSRGRNVARTGPEPKPVKIDIPDPTPTARPSFMEAGAAKDRVNLATRAAEQGQETTMTGSFLNNPEPR